MFVRSFTRIVLTVVLSCCFAGSIGILAAAMAMATGMARLVILLRRNSCLDYRSEVRIAAMFMHYITPIALAVVLLLCFAGFARILH